MLWLHWGPFDSFLTSVLKLWLWPCSDSWLFPLRLYHYSLFASDNTYFFTLYLAANSSCVVFNMSFFSILFVLLWSGKGKQRELSRYFHLCALTKHSRPWRFFVQRFAEAESQKKSTGNQLQDVILFLYLRGCCPTGAITLNTRSFAIGKLQLPQRSNGKESPCNIAYHCARWSLLT